MKITTIIIMDILSLNEALGPENKEMCWIMKECSYESVFMVKILPAAVFIFMS